MRYAIIKNINGAFTIDSEFTDLDKAKVKLNNVCENLRNAKDAIKATVCILDVKMISVIYFETIMHTVESAEKVAEE